MEISRDLYPQKESKIINQLWKEDPTIRHIIAKSIGKKLAESKEILGNSNEQLLALISLADFAKSDNECFYIYGVIKKHFDNPDPFPRISEHSGYELASRCLVSLGFFEKKMELRRNIHASPSPDFYRRIGAQTFYNLGEHDISDHFIYWESFFKERFILEQSLS